MKNSKIEWCDHTVNLWWGCFEVHKGCNDCYAKKLANRYHGPDLLWQQQGPRMHIKSAFNDIAKYQKEAAAKGIKYVIFVNSMSDFFEKSMPVVDFKHQPMGAETRDIRSDFFNIVDQCPNLIFLLLTKRPSNIIKMIPESWIEQPRENVMFGTSVSDQPSYDTFLKQLLKVPGKHFLSMEPLIGNVDMYLDAIDKDDAGNGFYLHDPGAWHPCDYACGDEINGNVDWVIVGGESDGIQPMHPAWPLNIQKQCLDANVPFFMKQWGSWAPIDKPHTQDNIKPLASNERWVNLEGGMGFHGSDVWRMRKMQKSETGSLLNGREYKEFPEFFEREKYATV